MDALRYYQQDAVNATYDFLNRRTDNPCIVCPTGAGKSHILAQICNDVVDLWGGRVLMLTHVKELVEQNTEKIRAMLGPSKVGTYSAGLNKRDMAQPVIGASIQSVYQRACEFEPFNIVIVDEAHLIPASGDGMYRKFLADAKVINPKLRVIGLTATDYRMSTGRLCGPGEILNDVCYEIGVRELILKGFLCPLKSKAGKQKADTSKLHTRAGEFIASEIEDLMDNKALTYSACSEIIEQNKDRNSVLIFTASVSHAEHIQEELKKRTKQEVGLITGTTSSGERANLTRRFKGESIKSDLFGELAGPIKYLVNVNVLTTGFDAPNADCIVLLRPTNSPGLYYQMVGRGFRTHPSKDNCLVLDFGGNILRHGPVDALEIKDKKGDIGGGEAPAKECPQCQALIHAGYSICPECGFEFEKNGGKHDATATTAGVLSGEIEDTDCKVECISYNIHEKRNAPEGTPPTMRVDYTLGLASRQSEWVCFEHTGFARRKAETWWKARSNEPVPETVEEAVELAIHGAIAETKGIRIRSISGKKFDEIIAYDLDDKPPLLDGSEEREDAYMPNYEPERFDDDIPF